ncbi:MAG TPA: M24 family metallopeptidase [Vicinamibacterales bacterium]|nr:M24 family metallopeptidase [Vicinamibacterales bacterium]
MPLDIPAVQAALREEGLDGWLLYDFHGSNPIARHVVGLGNGKMTTRRWYYLVPAEGEPEGLVHAIEPHTLDGLPGTKRRYAGREQLQSLLADLLASKRRIAMEYSPGGAIPYLGRVDAGTIDSIRALGVEVVSSGDLVQRFEACWDEAAIESHRAASDRLYRIKDRTFAAIRERVQRGTPTSEYEIQQLMTKWFVEEGLVSDSPPVVAVNRNAGNPHYMPPAEGSAPIGRHDLVLIDLWGKLDRPGAVYADITWMGYTGSEVPAEAAAAFAAIVRARDAAVDLVQSAARSGTELRGWEVDRAARELLQSAGYGAHILHRTGHSLGETVHGNGVHLDDYETHDDRRLMPGAGFTIEPGLYFETFGVRTEINVVFGRGEAVVTGPRQTEILTLA